MNLIWMVLVGFVVGVIAKFIHPGKEKMGFIATVILGILASVVAGYVGQFIGWYKAGQGAGFIASVVMAIVLLWAYGKIKAK